MKKSILLMAIFLTACSSGGGASSAAANTTTPQPSVTDAVAAAQASGAIPLLDRSTSLLGTDADGNGVRDDIDAYINSLPDTPVQKKALTQYAAGLNAELATDITQPLAVKAMETRSMDATSCIFSVYGAEAAIKRSQDLEKYSINTILRFNAYMKSNQASSGHMLSASSSGAIPQWKEAAAQSVLSK